MASIPRPASPVKPAGYVRAARAHPGALPPLQGEVARPIPLHVVETASTTSTNEVSANDTPPVGAQGADARTAAGPVRRAGFADPQAVANNAIVLKQFLGATGPGSTAAWKDTRYALRHFNNTSPLIVAAITTRQETPEALEFMMGSVTAIVDIFDRELNKNLGGKKFPKDLRLELESLVHNTVALVVEKNPAEPAAALKRYVDGMRQVYSNPEFASHLVATAADLVNEGTGSYKEVGKDEKTALSRFTQSRHVAHMRLYEAVIDARLMSPVTGVLFTYQRAADEVARRLITRLEMLLIDLVEPLGQEDGLTADQRAAVCQGWMRHASMLMASHYVGEALRVRKWIKDGQQLGPDEFKSRIRETNNRFDEVIEMCGARTAATMKDMIDQFLPRYSAPAEESVEDAEPAEPAPR